MMHTNAQLPKSQDYQRIGTIDSHTEGEPTRIILEGAPHLPGATLAEKLAYLRAHHDWIRSALMNEPRGWDALVGGLLIEEEDVRALGADVGVIFFNNVGYLNMCGHGTIGLVATLAHLGRITPGTIKIATPVGVVSATLNHDGSVSVNNVPSYRLRKGVTVHVPQGDRTVAIVGDIAWGGNWFFLCENHGLKLELAQLPQLLDLSTRIKAALAQAGHRGEGDMEIDHIELFGPPQNPANHARNFVLCPGNAYDRSPCGTGTSAKVACLIVDGKLKPGAVWKQESIIGSVFEAAATVTDTSILPTITGRAWITGENTLLVHPQDPFAHGIRA